MKIDGNPTHNENKMDENSGKTKTWVQNNGQQKRILNRTPRICRKWRWDENEGEQGWEGMMKETIPNATNKDEYECNYTQWFGCCPMLLWRKSMDDEKKLERVREKRNWKGVHAIYNQSEGNKKRRVFLFFNWRQLNFSNNMGGLCHVTK